MALFGCMRVKGVAGESVLDQAGIDARNIDNITITKRVVLAQEERRINYYSMVDKTSEVTTRSKFGDENDVADLKCIVDGIHSVLRSIQIITPAEFWGGLGNDKEVISLGELFEQPYSDALNPLDLDYVVAANNQLVDAENSFVEVLVAGGYSDDDLETSSAVVVDMKAKRIVDAVEVKGWHKKTLLHVYFVIPLATIEHPAEEPCQMTGRQVAEAMSQSLTTKNILRIAVVSTIENPYETLASDINTMITDSKAIPVTGNTRISKEAGIYCPNADLGHDDAQAVIGDLYYLGAYSLDKDLTQAYVWYSLAANKGNSYAAQQVRKVKSDLSSSQLIEANYQLNHWEPGHCLNDLLDAAVGSQD